MGKDSFKFTMQISGRERKDMAGLIAAHFGTRVTYLGAPGFEYSVQEWLIDKTGVVTIDGQAGEDLAKMFSVLPVLEENGVTVSGQAAVTISAEGHTGVTLKNLVNILAAKERFIAKVMGVPGQTIIAQEMVKSVNDVRIKTIDDFLEASKSSPGLVITRDDITFRWFAATLKPEAIQAYIHFALAVNAKALAQRQSTPRETETVNEKYTFRVWLLKMGFIGEKYGASRRFFLERLEGDCAFRTHEQAITAAKKRKKKPG